MTEKEKVIKLLEDKYLDQTILCMAYKFAGMKYRSYNESRDLITSLHRELYPERRFYFRRDEDYIKGRIESLVCLKPESFFSNEVFECVVSCVHIEAGSKEEE